ncbi:MAG: RNA polymerase sigma factor [Acidobacteriota bacterium]
MGMTAQSLPDVRPLTREDYAASYQEGYAKTVRFLASTGAPPDLAEEVAQAAWARGWERLGQLRQAQALPFWINSIAKNLLRSDCRKRQLSAELLDNTLVADPLESEPIDAQRVFAGCSETERELLQLYYIEGFTSRELSESMGLSAVGVRVRLTRLKRNLAGKMNRDAGAGPAMEQQAA